MFGTRKAAHTIIASGMRLQGRVEGEGDITIDGHVDGDVHAAGQVAVGPDGVVSGDIDAQNLTVSGRVDGSVRVAGQLHVQTKGIVSGELRYESLQVDRGGRMEGNAKVLSEETADATEAASDGAPAGASDQDAGSPSEPVLQA